MSTTINQLEENIKTGQALKLISASYNEIASIKLNRIRSNIERNINFAKELGQVMYVVKLEAAKRHIKLPQPKNGTAYLVITSNEKFYGSLEKGVLQYFLASMEKLSLSAQTAPQLILVAGKTGISYLKTTHFTYPFQEVILQRDLPNIKELQTLSESLKTYQNILVFHAQFRSVLSQIPTISDVSLTVREIPSSQEKIHHIFEPEIQEILRFFDTQITSLLLEQTFLEAELSRTSSRLVSMDLAERQADNYLQNKKQSLLIAKRVKNSAKMLEAVIPQLYGHY